jgi:alpha-mannosidase
MQEYYPGLYAKIKERVLEGRIEPQGAMWVEPDTNISGGEALVRQVLQGKRFFRQEFGVDVNYLWLPDVFGYSAALPQILEKAEDDDGMVIRLYESENRSTHAKLCLDFPVASAVETNLMEEDINPLELAENSVALEFLPFEIKTLKVTAARPE